jgi:uncharacterized damage-inducible protein DinB
MTTLITGPVQDNTLSQSGFLKDYFIELTHYINWADEIAIGWLTQINDEQWNQVTASSFSSIRETAIHMVSAKKIWIDFWTNVPEPTYLSSLFNGSRAELIAIWKKASDDLKDLINELPAEDYDKEVNIIKPNGEVSTMEFRKTVAHMVNHSTYHRGQLVTLLRHAGFSDFSNTDLFTFYLKNS